MVQAVVTSWPLFLGVALLMLGNGLQGTLLGVRADIEGFAAAVTGIVMSAFYCGLLLGALLAPKFICRVGHVRVFAAFAAVASAAVLLHAIFVEPLIWALIRVVAGFSFAGIYIVAESWLNSQSRNEDRAKVLSVYMIASLGGMSGGQMLLNVGDPGDFVLFTVVSILISLAVVPMLLSPGPAPHVPRAERLSLKELYETSPLGIVGVFTSGVTAGVVFGMGAVFAAQSGLGISEVASFMFALMLAAMLGQFPLGFLADRFDRRLVIIGAAMASGALATAAAWVAGPWALVLLVPAVALAVPLYSVSVAHTNDHLEAGTMVAAAGGLMIINGVGAAVGPLSAGLAISLAGPSGYAWFLGVVHICLALFGIYRAFRRASVPLQEQGPTVLIPRATPVAMALAQEAAVEQIEAEAALLSEAMGSDAGPPESEVALV